MFHCDSKHSEAAFPAGPARFSAHDQAIKSFMDGVQVLCCFCYANLATRWIIQDQLHVGNTLVDDCITSETLCLRDCLSYLACSSNARAGARGDHLALFAFLFDVLFPKSIRSSSYVKLLAVPQVQKCLGSTVLPEMSNEASHDEFNTVVRCCVVINVLINQSFI